MMKKSRIIFNYSTVFWASIFLLLALPLHSSNNILSYLTLFNNFTIFHAVLLVLSIILFVELILQRERIDKRFIVPSFFLLSIFISFVIGIKAEYNTASVLADFCYYLLAGLILFVYQSSRVVKKSLHEILVFASKAMNVSCCISLLMYFTRNFSFWGLVSFNDGRYFGGNLSLLIVTVPYSFYCYLHGKDISLKR